MQDCRYREMCEIFYQSSKLLGSEVQIIVDHILGCECHVLTWLFNTGNRQPQFHQKLCPLNRQNWTFNMNFQVWRNGDCPGVTEIMFSFGGLCQSVGAINWLQSDSLDEQCTYAIHILQIHAQSVCRVNRTLPVYEPKSWNTVITHKSTNLRSLEQGININPYFRGCWPKRI